MTPSLVISEWDLLSFIEIRPQNNNSERISWLLQMCPLLENEVGVLEQIDDFLLLMPT